MDKQLSITDKCDKCDKSFDNSNPSIICEHCTSIHCKSCWIVDADFNFCPWCFHIPFNNKLIRYFHGKCFICFDELKDWTSITLNCGHAMCSNDYRDILIKEGKSDGEFYVPGYQYRKENIIYECPMCRKSPDLCISGFKNIYKYKNIPQIRSLIRKWNMFPLYKYLLKQEVYPVNVIRDLIEEYRNFMHAKVDTQDFDAIKLSPAPMIDTVWHAHVLMSKDYIPFCNSICGQYIHHDPFGEFDKSEKSVRYQRTIEWLHINHNYGLNNDIWYSDESREHFFVTSKDSFQIFAKSHNGKTFAFRVNTDTKIWMLKVKLYYKTQICPDSMRLIFAGKCLDNSKTFGEYNIDVDTTLHLVLRLSGC